MGLPLLSVTSLPGYQNALQIINCKILNNFGPVLFIGNFHHASIVLSHLEGNQVSSYGKIITAQVSHVKISETRFIRNTGTLLGLDDGDSSVSLEVSVICKLKRKLCTVPLKSELTLHTPALRLDPRASMLTKFKFQVSMIESRVSTYFFYGQLLDLFICKSKAEIHHK